MLILLAWRNIWRNKTRSAVIVSSVALGILSGAFITALYFGMGNGRVDSAIHHEVSHLQIHHPDFRKDFEAKYSFPEAPMQQSLQSDPRIAAFSLRSMSSGMLADANDARGVEIFGIDPGAENRTREMPASVKEGQYLDTTEHNQILIGRKLAERMKLKPRSKVVLTFQNVDNNLVSAAFRVCGLYKSQNTPLEERQVYVVKHELDTLLGVRAGVHEAAILLKNEKDMDAVQKSLAAQFPQLQVENWKQISPETDLIISSLDSYSIIFTSIILLALSFGIINTMLMAILERSREIGMLMAIGMNKVRLFFLVLLETFFLTIAGVPFGLLAAWAIVKWLGKAGMDFSKYADEGLNSFGFSAIIYPDLPGKSVLEMILLVFIAALVSAIFPALKVMRLKPAEAIRR